MSSSDARKQSKVPSIDAINEMWDVDSEINELNLQESELKIPLLHAKYHKMWTAAQRKLIDKYGIMKDFERLLLDYYQRKITNKEDLELLGKDEPWQQKNNWNECRALVVIDPMMVEIKKDVDKEELRVKILEKILARIDKHSLNIRNLIELRKLDKGFL